MGKPIFFNVLIIVSVITFVPICEGAPNDSAVQALDSLWQQHMEKISEHQTITEICSRFTNRFSDSEFIPLVRTLAGWHYLKQKNWQKARDVFHDLSVADAGDPLTKAAQRMSQRWLTRIKHRELRSALRSYYGEHIHFPEKLRQLKSLPEFNENLLRDEFNKPWEYEPEEIEFFETSTPHDYVLYSQTLANSSYLDKFLQEPYGKGINLKDPELMDKTRKGRKILKFHVSQHGSTVLTPGNSYKGTTYVHSTNNLVILCNGDVWDIIKINHN